MPAPRRESVLASRAYAMLNNGFGGIDWSGLPVVAELLQVRDIEALVDDMMIIKMHKPGTAGAEG